MPTQLEKIPIKKKPKNKWIKQQYRLERKRKQKDASNYAEGKSKRKQKQQLKFINNGR